MDSVFFTESFYSLDLFFRANDLEDQDPQGLFIQFCDHGMDDPGPYVKEFPIDLIDQVSQGVVPREFQPEDFVIIRFFAADPAADGRRGMEHLTGQARRKKG